MKIGFDAYFAFHYKTGVAHYSRNLINSIATFYPDAELVLFTDKRTELYQPSFRNLKVVELGYEIPYYHWLPNETFLSAVELEQLDIFHGLDHGLPGIDPLKKVVTVHDLFFETHPELYSPPDVEYYRSVTPKACGTADEIVSISQYTTGQLVKYYGLTKERISVCYQTCNELFFHKVSEEKKTELREQFDLPQQFWLYVGSVIERKNLLHICEALNLNKDQSKIPLIVIGEGREYLETVRDYVNANDLTGSVKFISYTDAAKKSISFQQAKDIPAFYQMAFGLVYPSFLEGFGIPLIEAFASGLPAITSNTSSLPELGKDAALYVDPSDPANIAEALLTLERNNQLRQSMIEKGRMIVEDFTAENAAISVMNVYKKLLHV